MTGPLPPAVQLVRVLTGLCDDLTANWSTVLADERWSDVVAALHRLAAPGAATALARDLGDAESARLAELLLQRWSRIGEPTPAPAAAIAQTSHAELTVVVAGLEPGWTASWHGPVEPIDGSGVVVRLRSGPGVSTRVGLRVFGRTEPVPGQGLSTGHRTILTAEAVVSAAEESGASR